MFFEMKLFYFSMFSSILFSSKAICLIYVDYLSGGFGIYLT